MNLSCIKMKLLVYPQKHFQATKYKHLSVFFNFFHEIFNQNIWNSKAGKQTNNKSEKVIMKP